MTKHSVERPHSPEFDAFVEGMRGLAYRKRREFLWHRVRPRLSRFLYKFRALVPSDKTSVDRMRDILVRSKLWLSSPVDFNDPFDMSAKFIAEGTVKEKQQRIRELLKKRGLKWKQLEKQLPRLVAKPTAELAALAQAAHRRNVELTGVYSFGGDPRSILMWSHYASNHEGLCLQFEVAEDPETFVLALPVEYSEEYPMVNWISDFKKGIEHIILRKYVGWSYERESRIVVPEQAHQFLPFRPEALKGILLGCRAKDDTVARLRELIGERSTVGFRVPVLYRAVQDETEYSLVIKRDR